MPDHKKVCLIISIGKSLLISLLCFFQAALQEVGESDGIPGSCHSRRNRQTCKPGLAGFSWPVKTLVEKSQVIGNIEILGAQFHSGPVGGNCGSVLSILYESKSQVVTRIRPEWGQPNGVLESGNGSLVIRGFQECDSKSVIGIRAQRIQPYRLLERADRPGKIVFKNQPATFTEQTSALDE